MCRLSDKVNDHKYLSLRLASWTVKPLPVAGELFTSDEYDQA